MKRLSIFLWLFFACYALSAQKLIYTSPVESLQFDEITGLKDQHLFIVKKSLPEFGQQFQVIDSSRGLLNSYRFTRNTVNILGHSSSADDVTVYLLCALKEPIVP